MRKGWHDPEILYDLTWNYLIKNSNLTDTNYHWKIWVDWIFDTWWDNVLDSEKWTFWEKEPKKWKRHNNFTFHGYLQRHCWSSGRYHRDLKALKTLVSNSKHFRISGIFKTWQIWCPRNDILNITFSLITSVSNKAFIYWNKTLCNR